MKSQIYKISKKGAWGNGTVCTVSAAEAWQCEDLRSDSQHHGTYICNPQTRVWGAFRQTDAWSSLVSQSSWMTSSSERTQLSATVRGPNPKSKLEINWRRRLMLTSGLYVYAHTLFYHVHKPTWTGIYNSHTYTQTQTQLIREKKGYFFFLARGDLKNTRVWPVKLLSG